MSDKFVRVSGEVADEYWKAGLLWRYETEDEEWVKDQTRTTYAPSAPSRWTRIEFGILVEE